MIQAYFENIKQIINKELLISTSSIKIAVAWFTDNELFSSLLQKAKYGVKIELIILDDKINNESNIDYSEIELFNCKVWKISDNENNSLMHNKFCIIDNSVIITGSYNWSYKARRNHENITIAKENPQLIRQFEEEFYKILSFYFPDESNSFKMHKTSSALISYSDFSYEMQKTEYKLIKLQIIGLESELGSMRKEVSDFSALYDIHLGALTLELLELKKQYLIRCNDQKKLNCLEDEIHSYKSSYNLKNNKVWKTLDEREADELKLIYRKATKLCHPDLVQESEKKYATDVFNKLRELYELNDMNGIKKLYQHLKSGFFSDVNINKDTFKTRMLLKKINQLKIKRDILENNILKLRNSNAYITILNIDNMDEYFKDMRYRIEMEIIEIKKKNDTIHKENK